MKINVKIEAEKPEVFEEIDLDFPIYTLSGYNHESRKEYADGNTDFVENFEVTKIVSPIERFSLEKRVAKKSGETHITFTMEHLVERKPNTQRRYFSPGEGDYDKLTTSEVWDLAFAEFQAQLKKFG